MKKTVTNWTDSQLKILSGGRFEKALIKISLCSKTGIKAKHIDCGQEVWIPCRCKSPLCPICSRIWSVRQVERFGPVIRTWTHPRLVTLTLGPRVHAEQLPETIKRIKKCFHKLRQSLYWGGSYGFWRTEIAWDSKRDTYHVHIHCLTDWKWVKLHELSNRWARLTGGKHQPDVKPVDDPDKAIKECLKYVLKFTQLPQKAQIPIARAVLGTRSFSVFGGLKVPKEVKKVCLCPNCKAPFKFGDGWSLFYQERNDDVKDLPQLEVEKWEIWFHRLDFPYGANIWAPDTLVTVAEVSTVSGTAT